MIFCEENSRFFHEVRKGRRAQAVAFKESEFLRFLYS